MAIKQSTLRSKAANYSQFTTRYASAANEKALGTGKSAFLCHSHKDRELAKGLVALFQEQGVALYVDWQDHTMPEKPNQETARKIKLHIKVADVFLFMATANSKESRWCPWEIGYADGTHKEIYIIPTSDETGSFGNEYLDLYNRIDEGIRKSDSKSGYVVFPPSKNDGAWLPTAEF